MSAWGEREIENATVDGTKLGFRDGYGDIATGWVYLKYAAGGQGMGGYVLGGRFTDAFVYGVLNALEVESWEKLPGTPCRVDHEHTKVHRIGHFLKDKWFDVEATMQAMREASDARS